MNCVLLLIFTLGFVSVKSHTTRSLCSDCGTITSTTLRHKRVVGGSSITGSSHPWMVAVITVTNGNVVQRCGGTLIKPRWVLTSASCVSASGIEKVYASLNDQDLSTTAESTSLTYQVVKAVLHPFYNSTSTEHNIALLDLGSRVEFTNLVRPICLGITTDETNNTATTQLGWGAVGVGQSLSKTLQSASVPIYDNASCNSSYSSNSTYNITITDNMICTFDATEGACQQDRGGPVLVKLSDGRYAQVGVISYTEACGQLPGVHTRVSQYSYWITSTTDDDTC